MLDIKWIRENPEILDNNQIKRNLEKISTTVLKLDAENRAMIGTLQSLQQDRNNFSKSLASIAKNSKEFADTKNQVQQINQEIDASKEKQSKIEEELNAILTNMPNILDIAVPIGRDENDNKVIASHGEIPQFDFTPKSHEELGEQFGMMDFEQAAKISGSRFVILKKDLARLERALANFMLDVHTKDFGFEEVAPPYLVQSSSMFGTGQLPKFAEGSFITTDGKWLIPTSEVPLTNIVADSILLKEQLPIRMTAYTPCFRSEAGSAGKDTKGMVRLHQFNKVELVTICNQENNEIEFGNLLAAAKEILIRLGLPFREVLLCTGDTGFGAKKTIDLEVWLPSQNCYREISSCSMFGDFQARRMKARYRNSAQDKETSFVYTMNGSGLAVGRTLVAILENFQEKDGSVAIPAALVGYMGKQQEIKISTAEE